VGRREKRGERREKRGERREKGEGKKGRVRGEGEVSGAVWQLKLTLD